MSKYTVVVGNVGTMEHENEEEAINNFKAYVSLSKSGRTRAAGENVTLFKEGEIVLEFLGDLAR